MKISTDEHGDILLEEVYSGIGMKTKEGEFLGVCMRDTGFEFNYLTKEQQDRGESNWWTAQDGTIKKLGSKDNSKPNKLILVHYIDVRERKPSMSIAQYMSEMQEKFASNSGEYIFYFIPVMTQTRVECLNPKLVSEADYIYAREIIGRNQMMVDDFIKKYKL